MDLRWGLGGDLSQARNVQDKFVNFENICHFYSSHAGSKQIVLLQKKLAHDFHQPSLREVKCDNLRSH